MDAASPLASPDKARPQQFNISDETHKIQDKTKQAEPVINVMNKGTAEQLAMMMDAICKSTEGLPGTSVVPLEISQEAGDNIHLEFVQRFESDIGLLLSDSDTVEEKMAKIE